MDNICIFCGSSSHQDDAVYCEHCGRELFNYCANVDCDLNNGEAIAMSSEARYCRLCGHKSTFSEAGYFDEK